MPVDPPAALSAVIERVVAPEPREVTLAPDVSGALAGATGVRRGIALEAERLRTAGGADAQQARPTAQAGGQAQPAAVRPASPPAPANAPAAAAAAPGAQPVAAPRPAAPTPTAPPAVRP